MNKKIVRFDLYCENCRYDTTPETEDPCNKCLAMPVREDSKRPDRFWAKTGTAEKLKKGKKVNHEESDEG